MGNFNTESVFLARSDLFFGYYKNKNMSIRYYETINRLWLQDIEIPLILTEWGTEAEIEDFQFKRFSHDLKFRGNFTPSITQLQRYFKVIDSTRSRQGLLRILARMHEEDIPCVFNWSAPTRSVSPATACPDWVLQLCTSQHKEFKCVPAIYTKLINMQQQGQTVDDNNNNEGASEFSRHWLDEEKNHIRFNLKNYPQSGLFQVHKSDMHYFQQVDNWLTKRNTLRTELPTLMKFSLLLVSAPWMYPSKWYYNFRGKFGAKLPSTARILAHILSETIPGYLSPRQKHTHENLKEQAVEMVEEVRTQFLVSMQQISWLSSKNLQVLRAQVEQCSVYLGRTLEHSPTPNLNWNSSKFLPSIFDTQRTLKMLACERPELNTQEREYGCSATYNADTNSIHIGTGFLTRAFLHPKNYIKSMAGFGRVLAHEFGHILFPSNYGHLSLTLTGAEVQKIRKLLHKTTVTFGKFMAHPEHTLEENFADLVGTHISILVYESKIETDKDELEYIKHTCINRRSVIRPLLHTWLAKHSEHARSNVRANATLNAESEWNIFDV